jgi:hypothetical protein
MGLTHHGHGIWYMPNPPSVYSQFGLNENINRFILANIRHAVGAVAQFYETGWPSQLSQSDSVFRTIHTSTIRPLHPS